MNTPTPTPRTDSDSEITSTGMYICGSFTCSRCNGTAALISERDQLRAEVERLTKQAVFDGDHIHRRLRCLAGLCGGVCRDGAWRCMHCNKNLNYHP